MTIDTEKLRVSTKALVSMAVGLGGLLQIPAVNKAFTDFATSHPRMAPTLAIVTTIVALLHTPEVQTALGIKHTRTVEEKTEEVAVAVPGKEA